MPAVGRGPSCTDAHVSARDIQVSLLPQHHAHQGRLVRDRPRAPWKEHIRLDSCSLRPAEGDLLIGDPSKIIFRPGWRRTVKFDQLVQIMVDADLDYPD
jgi:GDP-D-mannose dehydratase